MKACEVTVADLYKTGGVSKTIIYRHIKAGRLTFKDGKADLVKLYSEWNRKRDPAHDDRIGPALRKIADERGVKLPADRVASNPVVEESAVDKSGAPMHLSPEMRKFWKRVTSDFELEGDALLILRTACEAWDRAQQARIAIARDGMVINTITDDGHVIGSRRHPAIDIEAKSQSLFLRAMKQLGLDIEPPGPVGRPGSMS